MKAVTKKGKVDTFSCAAGEDQFCLGCPEQIQHLLFAVLNTMSDASASFMRDATRIRILALHHRQHGLGDPRIDGRCCVIIEIDFLGEVKVRHVGLDVSIGSIAGRWAKQLGPPKYTPKTSKQE